jgi:O-antigen ligase/tetratricopeptide (TPR) repeat protein
MEKGRDRQKKLVKKAGKAEEELSLILTIIVILYAIVPVFTPNLSTLDSNGPKFLALALLNLISWGVIFFNKKISIGQKDPVNFIKNPVGLMVFLLIILSLISVLRVINIFEFLITFSKLITSCTTAFILFIIFRIDQRYFRQLIIVLAIILLIDCMSVFYGIILYIKGEIGGITDVKSVYSNKNILTSAIFVKVPVVIWLHLCSKNKWKIMTWLLLLFSFISILLLSTRAFYLGILMLTVVYLATLLFRYTKEKDKSYIRVAVEYTTALLIAVLFFSFIQAFLYPKKSKTEYFQQSIAKRLSTIKWEEESSSRVFYWKNSWDLIRDHPIMGVGLGNWKIVDLKYENRSSQATDYQYHVHNDFIETVAETGLLGGIVYFSIFLITYFFLIRAIAGKLSFREHPFLFLACIGLLCYSVDAFFNFPSDRAEIQSLFAIYIGSVICFTTAPPILNISTRKIRTHCIFLIHSLILAFAIFCLYTNFVSLHYQRITKDDIRNNKYPQAADFMLKGFPFMPDLSSYGEPLVCFKSRFLMNEKRYDEAIKLLQNDRSSPYDARVMEFICLNYHDWGKMDSSLKYAKKCIAMKPAFYKYTKWACDVYYTKSDYDSVIALLKEYTRKTKSNITAWNDLSLIYRQVDNELRSIAALDSGLIFCPGDSSLLSAREKIQSYFQDKRFKAAFQAADLFYNQKEYKHAIECYTRIIEQDTSIMKAHEFRGLSLFYIQEYQQAIADFSFLIRHAPLKGKYYNNRGVCYIAMKNSNNACRDFEKAKDLGDPSAVNNCVKFCNGK